MNENPEENEKKDTSQAKSTAKKSFSFELDYFQLALYTAPALVFLIIFFSVKYFLFTPPSELEVRSSIEKKETDPYKHLKVDSVLKRAEVEAKKMAQERAKAEAETEVMADGTIKFLSPRYKYFEFSGPLATNLIGSSKILTINISVAVYETPMKAEDFYEVFEVFVPVLRSIVIKEIGDFTLEMAEDEPTIFQFRKKLLEAFNKKLRDLGSQPILKKVVFSSFVIT